MHAGISRQELRRLELAGVPPSSPALLVGKLPRSSFSGSVYYLFSHLAGARGRAGRAQSVESGAICQDEHQGLTLPAILVG